MAYFSTQSYTSESDALDAALAVVPWLAEVVGLS